MLKMDLSVNSVFQLFARCCQETDKQHPKIRITMNQCISTSTATLTFLDSIKTLTGLCTVNTLPGNELSL